MGHGDVGGWSTGEFDGLFVSSETKESFGYLNLRSNEEAFLSFFDESYNDTGVVMSDQRWISGRLEELKEEEEDEGCDCHEGVYRLNYSSIMLCGENPRLV